jgi:hypothetical protein
MSANPQKEPEREQQELQRRKAVIAGQVMQVLGQPDGLHRVDVCQLWEDHYRVNVFVGADASCAKVAHSYFLKTGADATILASTPRIAKKQ